MQVPSQKTNTSEPRSSVQTSLMLLYSYLQLFQLLCTFVISEMENPEVAISSCIAYDDEGLCSYKQHPSASQELLVEDQLRRKLKFFFMNPCEKFWARGRKPWKFGIQLLKIAMVTIQVSKYGSRDSS